MIGGIYFAGAPFAGMLRLGAQAASLAASAVISFTGTATISNPPARLEAHAAIVWTAARADLRVPLDTTVGISIGGLPVTGRVRVNGLTIHDILNDAPNTATFTIEGEAPAVGQRVRITSGPRLMFTGAVQTIDQAYESKPEHLAWHLTAIDDTAEANARRPFGTWFTTSATTIATSMTTTFAPGFSTAGIAPGLEPVTIVFDGADPFIACLARLATAIGGYCKIEDHTVYLFTEDLTDPPLPLDDVHPFLANPPISMNTDASQLRTRVYGKGYGENVLADIAANETLLPIPDGALFQPLGGFAIAALTPDGAQSEKLAYTNVLRPVGGSLVGPGAAPANAPTLALAAGGVVSNGLHEVAVVHRTATGPSLAGPRGAITVGPVAVPTAAPTAQTAVNGTGPDQGSHQYAVTFLAIGGETTIGPASNAVTTSAASGQLSPPTAGPYLTGQTGTGAESGVHDYALTFENTQGETQAGGGGQYFVTLAPVLTGQLPTPSGSTTGTAQQGAGVDNGYHGYGVTYLDANGETPLGAQGSMVLAQAVLTGNLPAPSNTHADDPVSPVVPGNLNDDIGAYYYKVTFTNAVGETTPSGNSSGADSPPLPTPPSPSNIGTVATTTGGSLTINSTYVYHLSGVTASGYETDIGGCVRTVSTGPSTNAVQFTQLAYSSDPRVVKRNLYRTKANSDPSLRAGYLVTTFNDNVSGTSYKDITADTSLNTSTIYWEANQGTPSGPRGTKPGWQARVYNIPTGPAGTTGRKLYRSTSFSSNTFKLIATIADNTTTQYIDNIAPASEGATEPTVNTTGTSVPWNQIQVTNIPAGPAGTTGRRLYRNPNSGQYLYLADIPGNLTTSYVDTKPNAQLGVVAPTGNTTGSMQPTNQINVQGIQTGPAGTTSRRLYRRFNQAGAYLFAAEIGNNTTTTYLDTKTNGQLGVEAPTSNTTGTAVQKVPVTGIPIGPVGISGRNLYRLSGGAGWRFLAALNTTTTTYNDSTPNSSLGAAPPATNTATGNQIAMTQIPTGGSLVIARDVYMTLAGGGTLRLALTLADNTTRDATLNVSDATLAGAATPPATDTSGLQQPQGQVVPGSTTLIVASPSPFLTTGGWVITGGGQVVRYTGISGQLLTGVPASGAGAIVTTILYGQQATPAPMLVGVTGLTRSMLKGSAVHVWLQRDDLLAQSEHAARTGGSGIVEFLIVDNRRGVDSLAARCEADLALFSRPIVTVRYATRDLKTKSGKPIVINLPSQGIQTTLTIQDVTITEIDIVPGLAPRFTVQASSVRFSLEDTLRRLIAVGPITVNG